MLARRGFLSNDAGQNLTLVAAADVALEGGASAGDSFLESAPFAVEAGAGACLTVGDAILCRRADGLMDPAVSARWE